jgi:predicted RNA-binding Zn ribbon-like protein
MVRAFLAVWDDAENQDRLVALVRAVHTNDEVVALVREFVAREIVGRITRRTGIPDAPLRGSMAAAQLIGLATVRYVVRMPPMADASPDEIARWLGPTLQRYLVES